MSKWRWGIWGVGLVGLGCVVGCSVGTTSETSSGSASNTTGKEFKVALLTPGSINDDGWSAMAYQGLQAIEKQLGAETAHQETKDSQIEDAMRTYATRGFRLVIGHGFEYNEPAVEVAPGFPNTVFLSTSGAKYTANAGAVRFALEEGFYLAGVLAGRVSKSKVVGLVGGPEVPSIVSTFKAFKAGAEAQGAKTLQVFTNSNDDVAKAKQATLSLIDGGADVIIHQANNGVPGVFDACKERGVWAIGANLNQNDDPSGVVLASAFIDAAPVLVEVAKEVKNGTYKGSVRIAHMKSGAIGFEVNPQHKDAVDAEIMAELDRIRKQIESGELEPPMDKF